MMSRGVLLSLFALAVGVFTLTPNMRGVQIKNVGKIGVWLVMTGEESFLIPPGQIASVLLEPGWTGEIYAESPECEFEKCNNPHTTAVLKIGLKAGDDRYKVSVKEGFNRPITIKSTNPYEFCKSTNCTLNMADQCPESHKVNNSKGELVACRPNSTLFKKLCPIAVTSDDDETSNTIICDKSDTYQILFG